MKLNLGCGNKLEKNYLNIDFRQQNKKGYDFMLFDVFKELPFADLSIDEIKAKHVLEHISHREVDRVFKLWCNKLKIGGKMIIVIPNFELYINKYISKEWDIYKLSYQMFGGQDYEGNFHCNAFNNESLKKLFTKNNLEVTEIKYIPIYSLKEAQIKIVGVKK